MLKVLVLIENSRAAIAELRSLFQMENLEIHIAVNNKVFTDKIRYSKYIKQNKYYSYGDAVNIIYFLKKLVNNIGPFILLPNGETVLRSIVKSKAELIKYGIKISLPHEDTYLLFSDKYTFANTCHNFGINTPRKIDINLKQFNQKFVVKPKFLSEEANILNIPLLIENEESFRKFKNLGIDLNQHFIQKLIEGPSYYYCAVYELGNKKAWFVQKNLHQQPNGKSILKAIPYNLSLSTINKIDHMMNNYKWDGVMMFELKEELETGELFAIECNPRLWGPLQLALDNGVDFVRSLIDPAYECLNPANMKKGYIWRAGYFHGYLLKQKTKTSFQKFKDSEKEFKFLDIWGRKDTLLYFLLEPLIILLKEIRQFFIKN